MPRKGGKGSAGGASANPATAQEAMNLKVLRRVDKHIIRIEGSTAHATLFKLENGKDWKTEDVAGAFFIFARDIEPFWGIHVMNQKAFDNYHRLIQPEDNFETQASFLMFQDDGEYYGLWFGNDADRDKMCQLVIAKAGAAASGATPIVSYATKAGSSSATAKDALADRENVLAQQPHSANPTEGQKGAESTDASESDRLKLLLMNAGNKSPATGASTGDTQATASSSVAGETQEKTHLMKLLAQASAPPAAAGGATSSKASDPLQNIPESTSTDRLATLLMNAKLREESSQTQAHDKPAAALVSEASANENVDVSSVFSHTVPTQTHTETPGQSPGTGEGPRAPRNMAHMLQNPGKVTKVAVTAVPSQREPSILDKMRDQDGSSTASTESIAVSTTAQEVQGAVTKAMTELVKLQLTRAAATQSRPRMVSRDELRRVLVHALGNTKDDSLLASMHSHYEAIFNNHNTAA